ncbi:MAG: ParB/RepB/Spo0J family partition protein [Rhodospirillales bacterium]|jgi:ParB family chromosome partitioning protein|nr:ParB/RepB/Spo0J family partition protein [Rhodospirillales bacterium]
MKLVETRPVPILNIDFGDRLRQASPEHVEVIAASMADGGQEQAIMVCQHGRGLRLVAGLHRTLAAKMLGWAQIRADVWETETDQPELEIRLAEIDENLVRHELNPLDRAVFLAERKRVYQDLHPETKPGGDRRSRKNQKLNVSLWSFSKETAKRTGLSNATIKRATAIASRLAPDVRARLTGTRLSTKEGEIHRLSKYDAKTQRRIVEMMLDAAAPEKTVEAAARRIRGDAEPDPVIAAYGSLLRLWNKAPSEAREQFIQFLKGTGTVR